MNTKPREVPLCFSPVKEEDYKEVRCITCGVKFKTVVNAARCKDCTNKYGFEYDEDDDHEY